MAKERVSPRKQSKKVKPHQEPKTPPPRMAILEAQAVSLLRQLQEIERLQGNRRKQCHGRVGVLAMKA